jgi:hypothetical protein
LQWFHFHRQCFSGIRRSFMSSAAALGRAKSHLLHHVYHASRSAVHFQFTCCVKGIICRQHIVFTLNCQCLCALHLVSLHVFCCSNGILLLGWKSELARMVSVVQRKTTTGQGGCASTLATRLQSCTAVLVTLSISWTRPASHNIVPCITNSNGRSTQVLLVTRLQRAHLL